MRCLDSYDLAMSALRRSYTSLIRPHPACFKGYLPQFQYFRDFQSMDTTFFHISPCVPRFTWGISVFTKYSIANGIYLFISLRGLSSNMAENITISKYSRFVPGVSLLIKPVSDWLSPKFLTVERCLCLRTFLFISVNQ
jgi:hypothetical protein